MIEIGINLGNYRITLAVNNDLLDHRFVCELLLKLLGTYVFAV